MHLQHQHSCGSVRCCFILWCFFSIHDAACSFSHLLSSPLSSGFGIHPVPVTFSFLTPRHTHAHTTHTPTRRTQVRHIQPRRVLPPVPGRLRRLLLVLEPVLATTAAQVSAFAWHLRPSGARAKQRAVGKPGHELGLPHGPPWLDHVPFRPAAVRKFLSHSVCANQQGGAWFLWVFVVCLPSPQSCYHWQRASHDGVVRACLHLWPCSHVFRTSPLSFRLRTCVTFTCPPRCTGNTCLQSIVT